MLLVNGLKYNRVEYKDGCVVLRYVPRTGVSYRFTTTMAELQAQYGRDTARRVHDALLAKCVGYGEVAR